MNQEIFLQNVTIPDTIAAGFVVIKKMRAWDLNHLNFGKDSATSLSLTPFGKHPNMRSMPQLNIDIIRLPAGADELKDRYQFWARDRKKNIKLLDGTPFEPPMLSLKHVPSSWKAEGMALSRRCIVYVYTSPRHALVIRYLAYTESLQESPFIRHIVENLYVDEKAWVTAPISTKWRKMPPAAKEVPVPKIVARDIESFSERARELLNLSARSRQELVQQAICNAISDRKLKRKSEDLVLELGSLWGQSLCDALEWEWRKVAFPGHSPMLVVTNKDRSVLISPFDFVQERIKKRPNSAMTTLEMFHLLQNGSPPDARPLGYRMLHGR